MKKEVRNPVKRVVFAEIQKRSNGDFYEQLATVYDLPVSHIQQQGSIVRRVPFRTPSQFSFRIGHPNQRIH